MPEKTYKGFGMPSREEFEAHEKRRRVADTVAAAAHLIGASAFSAERGDRKSCRKLGREGYAKVQEAITLATQLNERRLASNARAALAAARFYVDRIDQKQYTLRHLADLGNDAEGNMKRIWEAMLAHVESGKSVKQDHSAVAQSELVSEMKRDGWNVRAAKRGAVLYVEVIRGFRMPTTSTSDVRNYLEVAGLDHLVAGISPYSRGVLLRCSTGPS